MHEIFITTKMTCRRRMCVFMRALHIEASILALTLFRSFNLRKLSHRSRFPKRLAIHKIFHLKSALRFSFKTFTPMNKCISIHIWLF